VGGAAIDGQDNYQQRNNYGGSAGGPILNDKLFFFVSAERNKQDFDEAVVPSGALAGVSGSYDEPFRDSDLLARFDWLVSPATKAFYRITYNKVDDVSAGGANYSAFSNQNNTPSQGAGLDFISGNFTHSFRGGYFKMVNHIVDATSHGGIYDPAPGAQLVIGDFQSGVNSSVPQTTVQSDKEIKYDGSWLRANHIVRFGADINRIDSGGFAAFNGYAPTVYGYEGPAAIAFANSGPFPGGAANPLNYGVGLTDSDNVTEGIVLGNGQGFATEISQFGFAGGGRRDFRTNLYVGDTWKVRPTLTLAYGLRYDRDTGRSDSDLPAIALLDQLQPGLGNRVAQPNLNLAPQFGLIWDPVHDGKTAIRAGVGIYHDDNIWNNRTDTRSPRLQTGLFSGSTTLCPNGSLRLPGSQSPITSIDGLDIASQICGQPIGSVYSAIEDLQAAYQAATAAAGAQSNPNYVGNSMAEGIESTGNMPLAPNYKSPVSYQMNAGFQHEIRPGSVLSVDYVRNVSMHSLLGVDFNHVGAAQYLNVTAAQNAIAATTSQFGCASGYSMAAIDCAIAAGANISSFAANGLDSETTGNSGFPSGGKYAFGGQNPNFGQMEFLLPAGRSVYSGVQSSFRQHASAPVDGLRDLDVTISYSFSRFVSTSTDQSYASLAAYANNPDALSGPNSMDRKHQISVGLSSNVWRGLRISSIAHLYSPLPLTLTLPTQGAGDIFIDDVTGDGTVGDMLPNTNVGSFMRDFGPGDLDKVFGQYNQSYGGKITPAGDRLITAGLMNAQELTALGAVTPVFGAASGGNIVSLPFAPTNQVGLGWLKTWDVSFSWPINLGERFTLEPSFSVFNVMNAANFDAPGSTLNNGVLQGTPGYVNGTTYADQGGVRTGVGSGAYALGAPRQMEFGLRLKF
jgi:hypothetical protein